MAKIERIGVKIETLAVISLDDSELAALDYLTAYGVEEFIAFFRKHMGDIKPHEEGLRSFLSAVKGCRGMSKAATECREFLALEDGERRRRVTK